jgi:hypothetical protein
MESHRAHEHWNGEQVRAHDATPPHQSGRPAARPVELIFSRVPTFVSFVSFVFDPRLE